MTFMRCEFVDGTNYTIEHRELRMTPFDLDPAPVHQFVSATMRMYTIHRSCL